MASPTTQPNSPTATAIHARPRNCGVRIAAATAHPKASVENPSEPSALTAAVTSGPPQPAPSHVANTTTAMPAAEITG
jgi:hypothetical protein